jgi:uncharacterized protein YfaS (alpha-2-macroglobulin family)
VKILKRGGALSFLVVAALLFVVVALGITEETPLGSISGSVKMQESGSPLPGVAVILTPLGTPGDQDETLKGRVTYSDKEGNFTLSNVPAGGYKIEASAKVHSLAPADVMVSEGKTTNLDLELKAGDPSLNLYTSQRVFLPDEPAQVEAHGFGTDQTLSLSVYKIDLSRFLKQGSIYGVLYSISDSTFRSGEKQDPAKIGQLVDSFQHKVQNFDAEGSFMDVVSLKKLDQGFYWVRCTYGDLEKGSFINISQIGLVTKSSPGEVLSFVTDLKTGQPVPGVQLSYSENGKWVPYGKTDADGLANVRVPGKGKKLLVLAAQGSSQAVSAFYLYGTSAGEASNYSEDAEGNYATPPDSSTTVFVYSDRPIYRPGDNVQFKGFARRRVGSQYNLPGPGNVSCEVRDLDNNLVKAFSVAMDDNGAFHGNYQTNEEDAPGQYTMSIKALGQDETLNFTLAAYRKPEFTIKVTWSKSHYTMGEKLKATVKCEYYFGGPVVGAKVNGSVYRNQDWYDEEWNSDDYGTADEQDDEGNAGGDFTFQSTGVTDANGEAVFEFDPKPEKLPEDMGYTPNYKYTLSADVTEAGDKYFSGQGTVKVSQGAIDLKVDPDSYIAAPGKNVDVTISTFKSDDQSPAAGQSVQVVYGSETWSRRTDKYVNTYTEEGHASVTTGADGTVHFTMPVKHSGSYLIKASTTDSLGNTIKQQGYLWAGTDDFEPPPTAPDLALTLDKKLYKTGDTCQVLITSAKPGLTALLTVEAESVMYKQVIHMAKQSQLVTIPVDKSYLPRVTISVVAVQNKKFLEASTALKVDVAARTLQVKVASDKAQYLPGSTATYTIRTTAADGKPTPADVSLGVVDEAIYALQEDDTNPLRSFYPARPNKVATNYSFPELYLDGGDKGGAIPVRMNFKDTAAWFPSIKTDATGSATVQVKLPDNLTKWRATAVGVSDATDVGLTKYDVVVNKPLMIRLQGPKFMVNGDHQEVAAVISNNSGSDANVHVSLEPTGFGTSDALQQTIHIDNGKAGSISWDMGATQTGPGALVAKAWIDGGPNDGVQQKIEIKSHAREVDFRTAGDIQTSAKFNIVVRKDADPNAGRLRLGVSPTIGTGIYDTLDALIDYPYGCVEQTMSRFMPAMVAGNSLRKIGLLRPDLEKKIPQIAALSISKLKNMQHTDGGWGWWENDTSSGFMTAYVLDGSLEAKAAGYKVSPYMTDKAVDWASKEVLSADATKWPKRDRLYLAYVLAKYGKTDIAAKVLKAVDVTGESAADIATAALLANELGTDYAQQRDELIQRVRDMAIVDAGTVRWKPKTYDNTKIPWWEYDDVYGAEVNAIPLQALEAITPNDPLIIKGIRNLLLEREGYWWWGTRDSSFALRAIAWYMKFEAAPTGPSVVHVLVNGTEVSALHMDIHNLRGLSPTLTIPISNLAQGQNTVELKLENANVAYYSVDFRQFAVAPTLGKPINGGGLTIDRSYHLLQAQQMEDGTLKLKESAEVVTSIKSGDLIQCDLVINSDRERSYLMITDPIPSNCHPETDNDVDREETPWDYWYADQEVYDDRLTFFATQMGAGRRVISYVLRAESPGIAHALPPVVGNMYKSDDGASDSEYQLEVRR